MQKGGKSMTTIRFVAVLLTAGVITAGVAAGQANAAGGPSVVGGGVTFGGGATFAIAAHSDPEGDWGYATIRQQIGPGFFWYADVDVQCVNVVENTAFVTGVMVRTPEWSIPGEGDFIGLLLKDAGGPAEAPVDGFTLTFGIQAGNDPETACRLLQGPFFSFTNVIAGDVRIS